MSRLNARAAFVPKFQRWGLGFLGVCVSPLSNELTTPSLEAGKLRKTKRKRNGSDGKGDTEDTFKKYRVRRCGLHL